MQGMNRQNESTLSSRMGDTAQQMKPVTLFTMLAAVCMWFTTVQAAQVAAAQLPVTPSTLIYDSRLHAQEPRPSEFERGRVEDLSRTVSAALWRQAWGDAFDLDLCDHTDFAVLGLASGAFTVRGVNQTALLYTFCTNGLGSLQGLVILQNKVVVAHYIFVGNFFRMTALNDINANGFAELALYGGSLGQGYSVGQLQIAELRPSRRLLGELNEPSWDNCGLESGETYWRSQVIRVTPGPNPRYTQQALTGTCESYKVATSAGPLRPLALKPLPTGWIVGPLK